MIGFGGETVLMPDAKGLHDLAALLAAPGRELHVRDLLGLEGPALGSDPVLDPRAKAAYRKRLHDLDEDIADGDAGGDADRAERSRGEREFLVHELAAAAGLGGRQRRLDDETETARKTVTARIRYTLNRLERVHPALATHLLASLRTGIRCSYLPAEPTVWQP